MNQSAEKNINVQQIVYDEHFLKIHLVETREVLGFV